MDGLETVRTGGRGMDMGNEMVVRLMTVSYVAIKLDWSK
jgi:hypothetical protein